MGASSQSDEVMPSRLGGPHDALDRVEDRRLVLVVDLDTELGAPVNAEYELGEVVLPIDAPSTPTPMC